MTVYPFMRYKWYFIALVGVVTLFALISILVFGLRLGIEFNGGVRVEVKLERPATVTQVREAVSAVGVGDSVVQPVGDDGFVITASELSDAQYDELIATLAEDFGAEQAAAGMERVGPSFGAESGQKALIAVLFAIAVIVLYITWRFEYKFALPAIVALVHDVALTLGVYAVTGRLVTAATVAAVLTILGYSINDTIIVFDRIRENQILMKKESYASMVDLSIRQTLARSINTALTTLMPIGTILLLGGATLKDFAFALFIGIAAGGYSSMFVASPILTLWKEREPRFRKRAAAEKAAR
ncbi:MAG: protein translocase subunit SecF [Actinobacteria bacterium]|nr:protein translocase subunit SecF [Actinomycetota bacterium]